VSIDNLCQIYVLCLCLAKINCGSFQHTVDIYSSVFGWWVGLGVEHSYLLMYLGEADKNSVRWGGWAVCWHKAGSFARLAFVCRLCVPCKCAWLGA